MKPLVSAPTADQWSRIQMLRSVLPQPTPWADVPRLDAALFDARFDTVVVDCEWHTDRCRCGRDLPDGMLETIGIGNDRVVVQIDWQAVGSSACDGACDVRHFVQRLVAESTVIYHNAAADIRKLREHGFEIAPAGHKRLEDTMLADAVLHAEEDHDLGDLNRRHGRLPAWKDLFHVAPDVYNAADLVGTYVIWEHGLRPRLEADPAAMAVYRTMSIRFLDLQLEGEEAGIRVNVPKAYELLDRYSTRVKQAQMLALAYTGNPTFSLASHDDVKHWLYNVYGLPLQRETSYNGDEGKVTADRDAIAALRRLHETEWDEEDEPTLEEALSNIEGGGHGLLEAKYLFGGAQQRLTHYVLACFEVDGKAAKRKIVAPRGRVFPQCRVHTQATGRVGYVEPALPQMKGECADLIMPDAGTVWIGHDWSNIETWLLGVLAGDEVILEAKARNYDTHVLNFCDMTGTPYPPILTKAIHTAPCTCAVPHDKTRLPALAARCPAAWREWLNWQGGDDLRRTFAKRFVYRLHYRGKAENAGDILGAKALGYGVDRLVSASEKYLGRHPKLVAYWAWIEEQADRYRVVYTFMGRPRRLTSEYRNARNREACNHPMQGGVSDIWITTCLLVKAAAPWARLVYGAFDSMWWQVPAEREVEFLMRYAPIVEREFVINGRQVSFPAEYKVRRAV